MVSKIISKLEICVKKMVFNCSTLKEIAYVLLHLKNRVDAIYLFVKPKSISFEIPGSG